MNEIKYKTYKTRKEISNHNELITAIIAFKEVYYCIFRNASNPRIEIRAYSPETGESFLYEINTKFRRQTTSSIKLDFTRIIAENDVLKNFDNISEAVFYCKGTHIRYREFTIYNNPAVSWNQHDYRKIERKNNIRDGKPSSGEFLPDSGKL